jgi:hypothetical protein
VRDQRDQLGALALSVVLPHPPRVGAFGARCYVRAVQRLRYMVGSRNTRRLINNR